MDKVRESGWLIERYWHSELYYWTGDAMRVSDVNSWGAFDKDSDKALRFARAADAGLILNRLLDGQGRVAEHIWIGGRQHGEASK